MKTEQQLDDLLLQVAPEIAPQRDLWPEISARLEPRPQQSYRPWLAVAAAALFTFWFWPQQQQPADDVVAQVEAPATLLAVSQQLQQQLNAEQTRQLRTLAQIPDGFADWHQQIAIWHKAQTQIELALRFEPNDQKLIQQLQRIQQQQLNYIAKLVQTSELT
jgi:hypothetical protein